MNERMLFITHSAGRTGAPIVLLHLLKWLKANTNIAFEILSKEDGHLRSAFQSMAPTMTYRPTSLKNDIIQKLVRPMNIDLEQRYCNQHILRKYKTSAIRLIYANTLTIGKLLSRLAALECPVICHVHELEYWIRNASISSFELTKEYATHYIAASQAVKQNLIHGHGISEHRIDVVHSFIDAFSVSSCPTHSTTLNKLLNIPQDSFIVGGSGYETWRKGKDLFIQLAQEVSRKYNDREIHFVWVGGGRDALDSYRLNHDIDHAGLSSRVHFVPEVENPVDYFRAFDVFAMVSREDPFPLVNLEAASLGKPIVCFDNAGGSPEFVEHDAGFVVPYLNIPTMADKVIALAENEILRKELGNRAAQKVRERHDISIAAPKILSVINRFLSPSSP